jgi:hypothetical protein
MLRLAVLMMMGVLAAALVLSAMRLLPGYLADREEKQKALEDQQKASRFPLFNNYLRVAKGMTVEEVNKMLGPPAMSPDPERIKVRPPILWYMAWKDEEGNKCLVCFWEDSTVYGKQFVWKAHENND